MLHGANSIAKAIQDEFATVHEAECLMYLENRIQKLISRVKDRELIDED